MAFKLAVCIPCHAPHLSFLRECVKSIEEQTRKPDMICISVSNASQEMVPVIESTIPILWHTSMQSACAGQNRNFASQMAVSNGAEILSFFDADDLMSPYRIECIEHAFLKYPVDVVLHNATIIKRGTPYEWTIPSQEVRTEPFRIYRDSVCGRVRYVGNPMNPDQLGTCGHVSVRSSIWEKNRHVERYGCGEDSEYIWRCVTNGARPGLLEDMLSVYWK